MRCVGRPNRKSLNCLLYVWDWAFLRSGSLDIHVCDSCFVFYRDVYETCTGKLINSSKELRVRKLLLVEITVQDKVLTQLEGVQLNSIMTQYGKRKY